MNTQSLKAVIDAEPANASRTDVEVLAWLKESMDVYADVVWERFALWCARYDGIRKLETSKTNADADIARAASTALMVLTAGKVLLLSVTEVRALMGNLVPNTFSVAEKDDLLAFSKSTIERFISHGFPDIDDNSWLSHIAEARV